jgi:hypothetical protein
VGPIIGVVGHDRVRLLVESNEATELSFNFYAADELSTNNRFLFEEVISIIRSIHLLTIANLFILCVPKQ